MRFVEGYEDVLKDQFEEIWYNKDGKEILDENEKFYAKSLTRGEATTYYIREYNGTLFNPTGMFSNKRFHTEDIRMVQVQKAVFDSYMLFLNTKNNIYLTKAERGRTNG